MELEYKWKVSSEKQKTDICQRLYAAGWIVCHERIHMAATYYDTVTGLIQKLHGGLRIRQENEKSVCCLKLTIGTDGGFAKREEYEVEAGTIIEAIPKLIAIGAPENVCREIRTAEMVQQCKTDFIRNAYTIQTADFKAELAMDCGKLIGKIECVSFEEMELELKSGDEDAFHEFANHLESSFNLTVQEKSKLGRALALK